MGCFLSETESHSPALILKQANNQWDFFFTRNYCILLGYICIVFLSSKLQRLSHFFQHVNREITNLLWNSFRTLDTNETLICCQKQHPQINTHWMDPLVADDSIFIIWCNIIRRLQVFCLRLSYCFDDWNHLYFSLYSCKYSMETEEGTYGQSLASNYEAQKLLLCGWYKNKIGSYIINQETVPTHVSKIHIQKRIIHFIFKLENLCKINFENEKTMYIGTETLVDVSLCAVKLKLTIVHWITKKERR